MRNFPKGYLGHCDDIRDDALGLKAPVMASSSAESALDLVGDADATGLADDVVD